ncbi:SICA antigen [Plasmodium coatneyi]|uniref:SICA antigen n=1 Tax=Plasmodium coatneyi TaxID=208452 RepID=A0A1B1E3I3_9APIC|nr:SICA antigen [Plasmodium coatneyi]ANQ09490.1 SICA antigen [Plasmodium coatneyi]
MTPGNKKACQLIVRGLRHVYSMQKDPNDGNDATNRPFRRTISCLLLNAYAHKLKEMAAKEQPDCDLEKGIQHAFSKSAKIKGDTSPCNADNKCEECKRGYCPDEELYKKKVGDELSSMLDNDDNIQETLKKICLEDAQTAKTEPTNKDRQEEETKNKPENTAPVILKIINAKIWRILVTMSVLSHALRSRRRQLFPKLTALKTPTRLTGEQVPLAAPGSNRATIDVADVVQNVTPELVLPIDTQTPSTGTDTQTPSSSSSSASSSSGSSSSNSGDETVKTVDQSDGSLLPSGSHTSGPGEGGGGTAGNGPGQAPGKNTKCEKSRRKAHEKRKKTRRMKIKRNGRGLRKGGLRKGGLRKGGLRKGGLRKEEGSKEVMKQV